MSNPRLLSAILGVSVLLLSGCAGSASPGVAARVGDETISVSRVDEATAHLCAALAGSLEADGKVLALRQLRQDILRDMMLRSQAEQVAEEYDLSPSVAFKRAVADITTAVAALPEEVRAEIGDDRERFIDFLSANVLATETEIQVGQVKLAAEGFVEPTAEQVQQAGQDAFASWRDANGIEVDPKFGLELKDGQLTATDTSLSFAVSEGANAGLAAEPDAGYVNSLPSSQRCGG